MAVEAGELAARLAARLCHDFANPVGGIQTGVDLLTDPDAPIPREEALALIQESARMLAAQLAFARVAFTLGDEDLATASLEALARDVFASLRPTLSWRVAAPTLPGTAGRLLLNLVHLGGAALATGGEVVAEAALAGGVWRLSVDALGARAKLTGDVEAGLAGRPRGEGLPGRWVQGAFAHLMAMRAGGSVSAAAEAEAVRFRATLPA